MPQNYYHNHSILALSQEFPDSEVNHCAYFELVGEMIEKEMRVSVVDKKLQRHACILGKTHKNQAGTDNAIYTVPFKGLEPRSPEMKGEERATAPT